MRAAFDDGKVLELLSRARSVESLPTLLIYIQRNILMRHQFKTEYDRRFTCEVSSGEYNVCMVTRCKMSPCVIRGADRKTSKAGDG